MRGFWLKTVCLLGIVFILAGYNVVLAARERDEELARLSAEVEALEAYIQASQVSQKNQENVNSQAEVSGGIYADGEWEGTAQGFGGDITLQVKVENGNITDVSIVSAEGEDQAYLSMAEDMLSAIVEAQSADVDTVTGATFSSTGIKNAAAQALEKAEN